MNRRNEVEKELNIKLNQYRMLNKSLNEMMNRRDIHYPTVSLLQREIESTLNEMRALEDDLKMFGDAAKTMVCPSKDDAKPSFYDSITKNDGKNSETVTYETYEGSGDGIKARNYINMINEHLDEMVTDNNFILTFDGIYNISSIMVKSVGFNNSNKTLSIELRDFVTERNGEKLCLLNILNKKANSVFGVKIERLDRKGNILYTERYNRCRIGGIFRNPISYDSDDVSTVLVDVLFDRVTYEAS